MDKLEARVLAQFSVMDALVGQLNSIGSFLTSSLKSLPGYTKS
jgi:flagellar capping protein FliD